MSNNLGEAKLRELVEKWRANRRKSDEEIEWHCEGERDKCADELAALLDKLPAPASQRLSEEAQRLATKLLAVPPPQWQYKEIQDLAQRVLAGEPKVEQIWPCPDCDSLGTEHAPNCKRIAAQPAPEGSATSGLPYAMPCDCDQLCEGLPTPPPEGKFCKAQAAQEKIKADRHLRIRQGLKLDGAVHIPEWGLGASTGSEAESGRGERERLGPCGKHPRKIAETPSQAWYRAYESESADKDPAQHCPECDRLTLIEAGVRAGIEAAKALLSGTHGSRSFAVTELATLDARQIAERVEGK